MKFQISRTRTVDWFWWWTMQSTRSTAAGRLWASEVRWGSALTPRWGPEEEGWMSGPQKVVLVTQTQGLGARRHRDGPCTPVNAAGEGEGRDDAAGDCGGRRSSFRQPAKTLPKPPCPSCCSSSYRASKSAETTQTVVRRVLQEEEIRGELWSERSTPPDELSPLSAPSVSRDPAGDPAPPPGSTRASEGSSGPPTASTWGGCCPVVVLHLLEGLGPSSGSSLLLCPHTSPPHTEHTSSLRAGLSLP
ncbi:uncharacterized protein LOC115560151 isoform X1 [Gadus morhua]|uniref:uncharacterized protein LOC115560151 isoform X1 n=1 Tax=Gadus morhua TaxID=8049 RepID=UPI0011B7710E|nr:uncharacterized protein LOC115560151 isoform X1 [Gadus morhua]